MMRDRLLMRLCRCLRGLRQDESGGVFVLVGLALVPLMFAVGFAVDLNRSMQVRSHMNAAADAAALSAVTVVSMRKTDADAIATAKAMFVSQIASLKDVRFSADRDLKITLASVSNVTTARVVTVSYTAESTNYFGGILGQGTIAFDGGATANATVAPNINFYLLMDVSPSMLLPSSSYGLAAIRSATGCAFACHTQNPHSDNIYVRDSKGRDIWLDKNGVSCPVSKTDNNFIYCVDGGKTQKSTGQYADSYWLTRNYTSLYGGSNIVLRIDEEKKAAQDIIPFSINASTNNRATYKMQFFTFDWTHPGSGSPVVKLTSNMTDVKDLYNYTVPDLYKIQDNWYKNNCPTASLCNGDMGTEVFNALGSINQYMPDPGNGSTSAQAQAVLFIITDGMSDETYGAGRWNREFNPQDLGNCTAIKNRGIRIAILYTEYLPQSLDGDGWSQTNVAPYLGNVEPALKSCASSRAGGGKLYYKVTTDENISAALTELFSLTVETAHLTK